MSSVFRKQFSSAGAPTLLNQFGETVFYRASGQPDDGSGDRCIKAMILREGPELMAAMSGVNAWAAIVRVKDDQTSGILETELDSGGDQLLLALEVGGTVQPRRIARLLHGSGGMTRFLVE